MAIEDHDFEEINHFYFKEKVVKQTGSGAVGRLSRGIGRGTPILQLH